MGRNLTNLPISASFQYLLQYSGSENDVNDGLGNDIDTLNLDITGTASTASYVAGANVDGTVASATSASYAENGGVTSIIAGTNITIDQGTGDVTISSTGGGAAETGSLLTTASISDAEITFTKGDGSQFSIEVNNVSSSISASHAVQADSATTATTATSASYVLGSNVDGAVASATSASHAVQADSATTATSASHAVQADNATTASFATTASYAANAVTPTLQQVTDEGNYTTNSVGVLNLFVNGTDATDNFLEIYRTGVGGIHYNLSGSAADDHMFEINQDDILKLQTSSITAYKDIDATGLTITANQVDASTFNGDLVGTASIAESVAIFGDATNAERKLIFVDDNPSSGASQVEQLRGDTSKSITYNPSTNTLTVPSITATNISASGYISASEFIGDGSKLTGIDTDPFPYTGSAIISGSLELTGSVVGDVVTLSISSNTASMDCGDGNMFELSIDQDDPVHLDATNINKGQVINLSVTHPSDASGSLEFSGDFKFPGGTAPTITAATSSQDVLTFIAFRDTTLLGTSLLDFQ